MKEFGADRRVFLYWAITVIGGFIATQLHQQPDINTTWLIIIVLGLAYMKRHMSFKNRELKWVWILWAFALIGGLLLTGGAVHLAPFGSLVPYLGVTWLIIMGLAHAVNGYLVKRAGIFWFSALLQLVTAGLLIAIPQLLAQQYSLTAVAGGLGMLWLYITAPKTPKEAMATYGKL